MVRCATNGCERSCSGPARHPTSWPTPCKSTPRPWSGGSPRAASPTAGTGSRWPPSWAWMSPTSGRTRWAATRSPWSPKARSSRCTRTAPRFPGTCGDTCLSGRAGDRRAGVRRLFLSEDAGIQKILKDKATAGARVRILLGSLTADVHRGRHTRSSALSCNCGSAAIDPRTRLPDRDTDSLLARRCRRWDVLEIPHILGAWRNIFGANDLSTARPANVQYADK